MSDTTTLKTQDIQIDIDLGENMTLPHLHALQAGLESLLEKVKQKIVDGEKCQE